MIRVIVISPFPTDYTLNLSLSSISLPWLQIHIISYNFHHCNSDFVALITFLLEMKRDQSWLYSQDWNETWSQKENQLSIHEINNNKNTEATKSTLAQISHQHTTWIQHSKAGGQAHKFTNTQIWNINANTSIKRQEPTRKRARILQITNASIPK